MTILRCINETGNKFDLDLREDVDFKLDISAIESGNIGKVFGVSSQRLALPPSKTNNEFFGNLYDLGATPAASFIKTVPCQILQNGIEIFTGKLYLESVVTDNQGNDLYNVVVVNETVDFDLLIKDTTFGDLDFSSLAHSYTYGNITSSWDQTLEGGAVFYPLCNYGFDSENPLDTQIKGGGEPRTFTNTTSPVRVDDFKPAIRVRDCLDAIFASVNYEYTSSLFSSGSYTDDIYMLATKDDKKGISDVNPISQSFRAYESFNQDYPAPSVNQQVVFTTESYDNNNSYDGVDTFTAGVNGTYQFEINLVYEILGYAAVGDSRFVDVRVFKNGSQFDTYNFDLTGVVQGQINVVTQQYNLNATDTIDIRVSFTKSGTGSETFRIVGSYNTRFKLLLGPTSIIGGTVDLAQTFSDISVPEFLQGLIEKFNLVIEPVKDQRNILRIETFNDWVDQGSQVDWSEKVDYNEKWEIRHPLQSQPKNIKFSDIEDNIAVVQYHKRATGRVYGDFDYISESDLAIGEKTIGKLFAPTPLKGINGSPQTIMPTLAEKDDSAQPFARTAFAPRLLYHNGRQNVLGLVAKDGAGNFVQNRYYFQDESGTVHTETDYGLASHLQATPAVFGVTKDLHFGNNWSPGHYNYHQPQFNGVTKNTAFYEYWSFYINELYDIDARLVTLNIFLDPTEIPQLQLNDKIHIDGHYYRINKIKGANVSREASVEVELIKTLPRKLYFPRRRVIGLDGTPIDITIDDGAFSESGRVGYVDFETNVPYTGSALQPAAARDGLDVYGNEAIWDNKKPIQIRFTAQTNLGLNRVDESAETIDARGDNNTVSNNVTIARVEGSDNVIEPYSKFITVTGTENTIGQSVENSAIQQSTTSSIANSQLATIIAGDNSHITGSNKSVAIGQDLTIQGGNSNIVVGNIDGNTKTIQDMVNVVAINTNRDIINVESSGGSDYNGIAYLGTTKYVGAKYLDYFVITGSAGGVTYLDATPYEQAHYIHLVWSGSNGTHTLYLPDTDPTIALQRGGNGYGREFRFFTDGSLSGAANNTIFRLQPSGSDVIDGALYNEQVQRQFDGITIVGTPGQWLTLQRKSK